MSVKRILVEGKTQEEKNTALMEASEYGDTDMARMLIDAGADVNAKNKYGETALVIAYQSQPDEGGDMAELLREYGGTECGTLRPGGIGAGGDFLALWAERKYEGYFR